MANAPDAPKKSMTALSRATNLRLNESDKFHAWRLSNGSYFGFVFDEQNDSVTLFSSPTESFTDASSRFTLHRNEWNVFKRHCAVLNAYVIDRKSVV